VLQRHVRTSDVIGRLGGDEFVLLLWNLTEADVLAKAALLEAAIDGLSLPSRAAPFLPVPPPVSHCSGRTRAANHALEQADSAMYARKMVRRAKT